MFKLRSQFTVAFLFILALTALSACGRKEAPGGGDAGGGRGPAPGPGGRGPGGGGGAGAGAVSLPPKKVKVTQSIERLLARTVEAPGTLAADEEATLGFKVTGRLNQLRVDLGTPVRKGQVLALLETQDFKMRLEQSSASLQQARVRLGLAPQGDDDRVDEEKMALVRQARAVLEEARSNHERAQQLVTQGIQPRAELDRTEAAFKVAESRYQDALEEVRNRQAVLLQRRSELQIARQQLAETTLYAPFDGAVSQRRANMGEYLQAGAPVATIVRTHPLRLRVEVPELDAKGIRVGQPVRVLVEGESATGTHTGRVARLSPAIQEQSRTLIIEAEVDNHQNRLRPGSFAKAAIQTAASQPVVTVPPSAVITFAGIQKIFSVKENKAVEHTVQIGRRESDWVEVTEGLKANETVILAPGNLVNGQPVNVESDREP